jgi:hypothetical protein
MVLDFDDPQMSLSEAIRTWQDSAHVIGTTKSHQVSKNGAPPCDRFRVAVPWSSRITDIKTYRYNMLQVSKSYPCDSQCKDGARLYYPCKEIVSIATDGYKQEVLVPPDDFDKPKKVDVDIVGTGILPIYVQRMLFDAPKPGRIKDTYFKIGCCMFRCGYPLDQATSISERSGVWKNATATDPIAEMIDHMSRGWYYAQSHGETNDQRET